MAPKFGDMPRLAIKYWQWRSISGVHGGGDVGAYQGLLRDGARADLHSRVGSHALLA